MITEATREQFIADLAEAAGIPAASVEPDARLVEDLAIDSLGLTQVAVMLIVDYDMAQLSEGLSDREWAGVTVAQLYEEYRSA